MSPKPLDTLACATLRVAYLCLALCSFSLPSAAQTDLDLAFQQGDIAKIEQYAHGGNARAQGMLALMLSKRGRMAEAKEWQARAAENGDLFSIRQSIMQAHAKRDREEVAKWYRRGAELGDLDSQIGYAGVLRVGQGVPRDEQASFKLYLAATKSRRPYAYLAVAEMYSRGEGTEQDQVEALANVEIALRVLTGSYYGIYYREAQALKDKLVKQVPPSQRNEAMRRARERRPDLRL